MTRKDQQKVPAVLTSNERDVTAFKVDCFKGRFKAFLLPFKELF